MTTQDPTTPPVTTATSARRAWPLLIAISFLATIGMTIVLPVLPFVVLQYLPNSDHLALWVGVLESVYALCAFLAAPVLGVLSDRFGRKPVLVVSVVGSAIGYLMFGIGGAIWVLLVSRIIDGLTAGDMPVLFAYLADITEPEERAKRYGLLGALSGVGFMIGPAIGGLLAQIDLNAPVFVTAAVAAVIGVLSATVLPETLRPENRITEVKALDLHPFKVLSDAFRRPELRALLVGFVLITIPFAFFANNFTVIAFDTLGWGPTEVGLLTSGIGVTDIVIQGALLGLLIKLIGERGVVVAGIAGQLIGCVGIAFAAAFLPSAVLFGVAALVFGAGQGAQTAVLDGLMSSSVGADEQGWLAGGISSLGSAVQMAGPLLAGWLYASLSHAAPYWLGAVLIAAAAFVLWHATRNAVVRPDAVEVAVPLAG
jgi:DHA1 family tetracycline resistance protein-like MFS transporter